MKKGINAWSFPGAFQDQISPIQAVDASKRFGFDAVELCIGEAGSQLGTDFTQAQAKAVVAHAQEQGIAIETTASGLYWQRSLGDPDPAVRVSAEDDLKRMLEISSWLGAKVHLTIPAAVDVFFMPDRPVQPHAEIMKYASEGMNRLVPHAEAVGVKMGIENVWNKILLTPSDMRAFVTQFRSPFVGVLFDVGNILPFGYPEMWIRDLRELIVAVHFKDFRKAVGNEHGFVDILEGDVNWPEVMAALTEIGFSGPLVAEMIPHYNHHGWVRVANTSNALDALLGRFPA